LEKTETSTMRQSPLTPTIKQLIVLCFLRFKMQIHAHLVSMRKDNFPLCTLAHVDSCSVCGRVASIHEDVIVVAFNIQSQETESVQSLGGKVVEIAPMISLPFPPAHVGSPGR
jgi:hypothetical protein